MATYSSLIPQNSDSPGIFPAQAQGNFTRLQEIIEADHQFNNTSASNDGYHNLVHMTVQSPAGALAGIGRLYVKTVSGVVQLYYMDDAGNEHQVTPRDAAVGLFAAVNFNGISGAVIRGSPLNVASVVHNGTGKYTVNFINPAPHTNYIVQVTGMRDADNFSNGFVLGNAIYGNSVQLGLVKVGFSGEGSAYRDTFMGNVMVYIV